MITPKLRLLHGQWTLATIAKVKPAFHVFEDRLIHALFNICRPLFAAHLFHQVKYVATNRHLKCLPAV